MVKKSASKEENEFIARVAQAIEFKRKTFPDLTDQVIADALGTDRSTVTNYQSIRAMPRRHISKFCEFTGVSERWLISNKGPMEATIYEQLEKAMTNQLSTLRAAITSGS